MKKIVKLTIKTLQTEKGKMKNSTFYKMNNDSSESSFDTVIVPDQDEIGSEVPEKSSSVLNTIESIFSLVCRNNEIIIMPKIMADCGFIGGTVMFVAISVMSFLASYGLCKCAQKLKVKSIIDLCLKVFPQGSYLFNSFLMTLMIGAIVCSQLLIVDTMAEMLKITTIHSLISNSYFMIAALNACMLFFSYSKTLQKIKVFSNVASIGYILAVGMMVFHYFSPFYNQNIKSNPIEKEVVLWSTKGIISNIGLMVFSFTIQDVIIDFDAEIKPQNPSNSKKFTTMILIGVFSSYYLCGFFGYLAILRDPEGPDQENFLRYLISINNGSSSWLILANLTICINLLFDSLVSLIPITDFIDMYWLNSNSIMNKENESDKDISYRNLFIKFIFSLLVAGLLVIIVFFKLDVQAVHEIMSSLCIIPISVVFPLYFYNICFPQSMSKLTFGVLMASSLVLWALSILGCVTYL